VSIKTKYWKMTDDLRMFPGWILRHVPGHTGIWLRARFLRRALGGAGANNIFHENVRIVSPKKLHIGDHCSLAAGVFITAGGGVTIGNHVGMGPDTKIWSVNHRFSDPDTPWMGQGYDQEPVFIEDDVWLGANVFVMPGVRIGRGAIVSAGTVLSKAVPAYAIVAGNPGRVVAWRKAPVGSGADSVPALRLATASGTTDAR